MFGIQKRSTLDKIQVDRSKLWFDGIENNPEHMGRINHVNDTKLYLLRHHPIQLREDIEFKEEIFEVSKTTLQSIKSVIEDHVSYGMGNPISLTGQNPEIITVFNAVYKKGNYDKTNMEVYEDIFKFGNAFEFVYQTADEQIKSKIIDNADAMPVYDDQFRYVAFVEHWREFPNETRFYIVYYPDVVETYRNGVLIDSRPNWTGYLPIHYCGMDKSEYTHFGESPVFDDLKIIVDAQEALISDLNDGVTTHSLKPLAVAIGKKIDTRIPKNLVGTIVNLIDENAKFGYATAMMDATSVKLLLDTYQQAFYSIACTPATNMGQMNIANVSETSLRLLYSKQDNKAKKVYQVLREGINKRHECIRKLLALQNKKFTEEVFYGLDFHFTPSRPVDNYSLLEELAIQRSMGAISIQTIIEQSPYTVDVAVEMQRLKDEAATGLNQGYSLDPILDNARRRRLDNNVEV